MKVWYWILFFMLLAKTNAVIFEESVVKLCNFSYVVSLRGLSRAVKMLDSTETRLEIKVYWTQSCAGGHLAWQQPDCWVETCWETKKPDRTREWRNIKLHFTPVFLFTDKYIETLHCRFFYSTLSSRSLL